MPGKHSAEGPLGGYLWQVRHALRILIGLPEDEGIVIEGDDDIVQVDYDGRIVAAHQDKHSFNESELTVTSRETWKTLRSWVDIYRRGRVRPGTRLVLYTTATVPEADPLRSLVEAPPTEDGLMNLLSALDDFAATSKNSDLRAAFDDWRMLDDDGRRVILRQAGVVPAAPRLAEAQRELQAALRKRGVPENLCPVVEQSLVGWFHGELEARLALNKECRFESFEIQGALWELAGWYGPADVLYSHAADEVPDLIEEMKKDPLYLKQLSIIKAKREVMTAAVVMFSRGNAERGAWLRKITGSMMLKAFDADLENHWINVRAFEAVDDGVEEPEMHACGARVLKACVQYPGRIGSGVAQVHLVSGSFHYMADTLRIGWHPKYETILRTKDGAT